MLRSLFLMSAMIAMVGAASAWACPGKLGVARTVKLSSIGGRLHGGLQYQTDSFLKAGEVVLTFDDGPLRSTTRKVLAALKDHCTKGTFFMVGRMAVADPAMVREVANQGHTIASHTWSHKNLHRRSTARAKGEIELGISAIQHALGKPITPFFRFPYLADPKSMIDYGATRNLAIFSIDIDSYDYRTRSGDTVRRAIMRQLAERKKGIILFHDIQISTARAIQSVLNELHRKGYKVVHITSAEAVTSVAAYDEQAADLHKKRRYSSRVVPVGSGSRSSRTVRTAGRASATGSSGRSATLGDGRQPSGTRKPRRRTASTNPAPRRDDSWKRQILGN